MERRQPCALGRGRLLRRLAMRLRCLPTPSLSRWPRHRDPAAAGGASPRGEALGSSSPTWPEPVVPAVLSPSPWSPAPTVLLRCWRSATFIRASNRFSGQQDGRFCAKGGHGGDAPPEAVEGPAKRAGLHQYRDPGCGAERLEARPGVAAACDAQSVTCVGPGKSHERGCTCRPPIITCKRERRKRCRSEDDTLQAAAVVCLIHR